MKTVEQQTLQVLHRVRTQWQAARTARINAMRGMLREFGFPIGVGARTALKRIPALLEDATIALPELVRHTLAMVLQEARDLEARIATIDQHLARVVREHADGSSPGADSRAWASSPRRRSSGRSDISTPFAAAGTSPVGWGSRRANHPAAGADCLGGISKRGDVYLRCLLTHGARSVLLTAQRTARVAPNQVTRFQQWAVDTCGTARP